VAPVLWPRARWAGLDPATPVSAPVQRFALYGSSRYGVHLAAPKDCKIHDLPNALAVQKPHEIVDAPDRFAVKCEDDIALLEVRLGGGAVGLDGRDCHP
jgi:hypothetical protein